MSPLARIWQAAACTALACFCAWSWAAEPPAQGTQTAGHALRLSQAPQVAPQAGQAPQLHSDAGASRPQPAGRGAQASDASQQLNSGTQPNSAPPAPQAPHPLQAPQPPHPDAPAQLTANEATRVAQSALLSVDGTVTADALRLGIRRVADNTLVSTDDVSVTVDGRNQSVTRAGGGGYEVPLNDLRGEGVKDLEIVVAHDGIREILAGKATLAQSSSAGSLLADHKQVAWWILNIVIVLIAAITLSRRKG